MCTRENTQQQTRWTNDTLELIKVIRVSRISLSLALRVSVTSHLRQIDVRSPGSPSDLRDLLGHDARIAEAVDEQRPRLGSGQGWG